MKKTPLVYTQAAEYLDEVAHNPYILRMKCFVHHHKFKTYDHVLKVAKMSLKIAEKFHVKKDLNSLVRGAMLHDYYLYNWRDGELWHFHHIHKHPHIAYVNACHDFPDLDYIERDIILHHMFPHPIYSFPRTKQGWIVVLADKLVSMKEYFTKAPKITESVVEQKAAYMAYNLQIR